MCICMCTDPRLCLLRMCTDPRLCLLRICTDPRLCLLCMWSLAAACRRPTYTRVVNIAVMERTSSAKPVDLRSQGETTQ